MRRINPGSPTHRASYSSLSAQHPDKLRAALNTTRAREARECAPEPGEPPSPRVSFIRLFGSAASRQPAFRVLAVIVLVDGLQGVRAALVVIVYRSQLSACGAVGEGPGFGAFGRRPGRGR